MPPLAIRPSVTLSLVPTAKGGPFVYWDSLETACLSASRHGFAAIEIFPSSAEDLPLERTRELLDRHQLKVAAVGTGAGWLIRRYHLTHRDLLIRERAREFISGIIRAAAALGAPAIIGSMQGRYENDVSQDQALGWLRQGLDVLGDLAGSLGVPLFYEPLNRYESNLINRTDDAVVFLDTLKTPHVKILADLFHMNIEEASIPDALRTLGERLGHLHFVDSNRRPAGLGHIPWGEVAAVLREIQYRGYASAEALPYPDTESAATQTMVAFRAYFGVRAQGSTE